MREMDMASSVRECSERLLLALAKSPHINLMSVPELLGEKSMIAYQAIGWLAREGMIRYIQDGNQVYVSLSGDPT